MLQSQTFENPKERKEPPVVVLHLYLIYWTNLSLIPGNLQILLRYQHSAVHLDLCWDESNLKLLKISANIQVRSDQFNARADH